MTLQNRVTPFSEIVKARWRGTYVHVPFVERKPLFDQTVEVTLGRRGG